MTYEHMYIHTHIIATFARSNFLNAHVAQRGLPHHMYAQTYAHTCIHIYDMKTC